MIRIGMLGISRKAEYVLDTYLSRKRQPGFSTFVPRIIYKFFLQFISVLNFTRSAAARQPAQANRVLSFRGESEGHHCPV